MHFRLIYAIIIFTEVKLLEFFVIVAVAAVLCIVLGISMEYIVYAAVVFALLIIAAMEVFFLVSGVILLRSEKAEGTLVRIEKNEKYRFRSRIYAVDGKELPCIYPTDGLFSSKALKSHKLCRLRVNRKHTAVFDRAALVTFVCGFVFSNIASAAAVYLFTDVLRS